MDARAPGDDRLPELPWLLFELDRRPLAIALSAVQGVVESDSLRALPRAPRGVCGLAQWRGSLITVLGVERAPRAAAARAGCLLRFSGAWSGTALRLARPPRVGWSRSDPGGDAVVCEGKRYRRLDPGRLIDELLARAEG